MALGFVLVGIWYASTTPEYRQLIVKYLREANYFWVGVSLLLGFISHLSRTIRWQFMLQPMGYTPKFMSSFFIVLLSYFYNLGIPRSGEIIRATALKTYENVPFDKGFGTVVAERIIDLCMLSILVVIAFFSQTDTLIYIFENKQISVKKIAILLSLGVLVLLFFVFFLKKSNHFIAIRIKKIIKGLLEGFFSVFKMPKKMAFMLHTLIIWGCYIGMFWVIKFCFLETEPLSLDIILIAFIGGAFAMSVTNGGLGLFPIAVSKVLMLYGVSKVSAESYGWIMWISQTFMVILLGILASICLPLLYTKK